jgi:hypothetical protein
MKFYDILLEILTQDQYEPYSNIEREKKVEKMMDQIFDQIKKIIPKHQVSDNSLSDSFPPYVSSKDGDRLYIPFSSDPEGVDSYNKQVVVDELDHLGYDVVDYKKGLARKDGQVIKIGKVLSRYDMKEVLNMFNNDPARVSSKNDDFMIVFSKHPYDIAGMSTDRSWRSCQNIDDGSQMSKVMCGVVEGTIVIYLISGMDKNIESPIARTLAKQYVNKADPNDIMYVVSGVYGNAPSDFIPYVKGIFDVINKEKIGTYRYNSDLYNDESETINKYDINQIINDPSILKNVDFDQISPEDRLKILIANPKTILYLGDIYLSEDNVRILLRNDKNYFEQDIDGHPLVDWVYTMSRASYYNVILNRPKYFRSIENFGYGDTAMAYLNDFTPIFINRKGELDLTDVDLNNLSSPEEVYRAAYYNTLLKDPKYTNFDEFGKYGGDIAVVWTKNKIENQPRIMTFVNRDFQPDLTGVDIKKLNNNYLRGAYFNQLFGTKKFGSALKTENPNIFIMIIKDPEYTRSGRDFEEDAYYMNINGKPDLTGIDIYNAPVGAVKLTKEMIQGENLNEIKNGFNRFI